MKYLCGGRVADLARCFTADTVRTAAPVTVPPLLLGPQTATMLGPGERNVAHTLPRTPAPTSVHRGKEETSQEEKMSHLSHRTVKLSLGVL